MFEVLVRFTSPELSTTCLIPRNRHRMRSIHHQCGHNTTTTSNLYARMCQSHRSVPQPDTIQVQFAQRPPLVLACVPKQTSAQEASVILELDIGTNKTLDQHFGTVTLGVGIRIVESHRRFTHLDALVHRYSAFSYILC